MISRIPEAHAFMGSKESAERARLYLELVDLVRPHARAMVAQVQASESQTPEEIREALRELGLQTPEAVAPEDGSFLDHDTELVAQGVATSWLQAFYDSGSVEFGPDLLPMSEEAREGFFGRLANYGYTADQLAEVLSGLSASMSQPSLPAALVRLLVPFAA